MKHMRNKLLNILLIVIVAVSFSGCGFHKATKANVSKNKQITLDAEQEKNAQIETETLGEQLLQLKITIPAQFKAMNKFLDRIYAPIDGKVVDVFVEIGRAHV